MPLVSTIANASARGFGLFGGPPGGPYFAALSYSGDDNRSGAVVNDADGNVYVCGYTAASGNENMLLIKYSPTGLLLWQKSLASAGDDIAYSITIDLSNNIYLCGYSPSGSYTALQLAKYNSSGALQWQRSVSLGSLFAAGRGITVDGSGDIYIATSAGFGYLTKFNSSGTLQWQRALSFGATSSHGFYGVDITPSGNVAVVGADTDAIVTALYNSSGTLQWQKSLTNFGRAVTAGGCSADSSGNVYVCGSAIASSSYTHAIVAKYNSSGVLQWSNAYGPHSGTQPLIFSAVQADDLGGVYAAGYADTVNDLGILVKYDSSGSVTWGRSINSNSAGNYLLGVSVNSPTTTYVAGFSTAQGTPDVLVWAIPKDGTLTGSYVVNGNTFFYVSYTATNAASWLTDATPTYMASIPTYSAATSSLTDTSATLLSAATLL